MRRAGRGRPYLRLIALVITFAAVVYVMSVLKELTDKATPPAATPEPDAVPVAVATPEPETPRATQAEEARAFQESVGQTATFCYDGDTIVLADGRRVRYVGVDTPERDTPFFEEATALNKRLVEMKPVRLEVCRKRPTDDYGRTLARVVVGETSVEDELLTAGLAEVFHDRECIADCRPAWKLLLAAFQARRGMFAQADVAAVPAVVADRLIGAYGIVEGVVRRVGESSGAYHLDFGDDWTTDFTVTIAKADLEAFLRDKLEPHALAGMRLTVFGKVSAANGPHIYATCPAQILKVAAP